MVNLKEWKPCEHIFSNGTEFELFEDHCCSCTKYRNAKCKILSNIYRAMWDEDYFPYESLLEHRQYGGKICKEYTTVKPKRNRNKDIEGQMSFME
ncbi:MAG: hypothetical protein IKF90_10065 [Parasporobacterium sp.]|nr:hypothetical protein [Parasporobacterium sp.]